MPSTKSEELQTKVKKNQHFKKQKQKLLRATEPLLSVFMWGVNHTINELACGRPPVMLLPNDFKAFSKIRVHRQYFHEDVMPSHFKVKEYCPWVFHNLRERFGIGDEFFVRSLALDEPRSTDLRGRSGARFFESRNGAFVVKFVTSDEVAALHDLLQRYHQYIVENKAATLLPQFYALYRVTFDEKEIYLLVMRNSMFSAKYAVQRKYDLKGSTVDRSATDEEKSKPQATLKDNDFVQDGLQIEIGPEMKKQFLDTLQRDVQFLVSLKIMDYSLLVGIHDCNAAANEPAATLADDSAPQDASEGAEGGEQELSESDEETGFWREKMDTIAGSIPDPYVFASAPDSARNDVYYLGLVDILTHYGMRKRTANVAKTMKHGVDAEISTVKPEQYGRRFMEFISKSVR